MDSATGADDIGESGRRCRALDLVEDRPQFDGQVAVPVQLLAPAS